MQYSVYILKCIDGSLYTGITTDVKRRLNEHKSGKGGHYTRSHPPKKLLYVEAQPTRGSALVREAAIKRLSRTQKLVLCGTH
ncbi:MAG: GIY-YIG nuclease family protein [Patescibacteria group bacterium]